MSPNRLLGDELRPSRVAAVTARNLALVGTGGSYAWLIVSGLVPAVLYLFGIGWGVGALVGDVPLPGGTSVPYVSFVAPAMLAVTAMSGSLSEATINFFAKLRYWKHYDSVLNTPVTPAEVALGELGWAVMRGAMNSLAFVAVMAAMGLATPLVALAALPAALLVGSAFAGLGLAFSVFMRDWEDFEYSGVVQFALFMFSGTFVPVTTYPAVMQVVVQITPLYQAVALVRGVTLGTFGWGLVGNAAYLAVLTVAGLAIASRGMRRRLRR
jgi:lipooligosaccharide transport system permease protein